MGRNRIEPASMSAFSILASSLRTGYRRAFRQEEDVRKREVVSILRQVPVFSSLSGRVLGELAEAVHNRTYRRDEILYYEGDPGLGLYIIRQGRVRLLMEDEEGILHELRQLGEFEVFGELSLFGDLRRNTTVQALTETHVLGFFRPDLHTLMKRDPQAAAAVTAALAQYLAARQVELTRLIAARENKIAAAMLVHGAVVRTDIIDISPL